MSHPAAPVDLLVPTNRTWSQDDVRVTAYVPAWLQDGLLDLEIAKAELAVQLDRRLDTARSGGRR